MKKNKGKLVFIFFLIIPCCVAAIDIVNPIPCDDIPCLLNLVVSFIRNVALMIAPIIFIIAGLMHYFLAINNMKKYKILILLVLLFPLFVFAQVTIPNPIGYNSVGELIHGVVNFIRNVALMIAPIIFIIAGLMYYFAGGSPEKVKKATDLIKYAIIGLVIILIANGITAVIKDIMGVSN